MRNRIIILLVFVLAAVCGWIAGDRSIPAGAVVYEDGSWQAPNGSTGCILFNPCED